LTKDYEVSIVIIKFLKMRITEENSVKRKVHLGRLLREPVVVGAGKKE
jgi:hypothetical protein